MRRPPYGFALRASSERSRLAKNRLRAATRSAVESLEARRLFAVVTVNTTADDGDDTFLTLREAINITNGSVRLDTLEPTQLAQIDITQPLGTNDTIDFNIPGGGMQTITPLSALPAVDSPVTIDGYTQPGSTAATASAAQRH